MRHRANSICAALIALAAATSAAGEENPRNQTAASRARPDAVPESIRQFFSDYFRAVEAGDPAGILALIDTDFVIKWPLSPPITDRERLRSALLSLQQRVRQEIRWEILEARVAGDWAWVRSTETPTHYPRAGGDPRTYEGSRLTILRNVGGKWLMHRDHGSLNALPTSGR